MKGWRSSNYKMNKRRMKKEKMNMDMFAYSSVAGLEKDFTV